jgi:hypothetical protein
VKEVALQIEDLTIEVRNKALKRVGIILPTEATFMLRDEWNAPGSWTLTLPVEHPMVFHLRVPGSGIVATGPNGLLYTGRTLTASSKGSKDQPEGTVQFTGATDDLILGDYTAWPVPENATIEGQKARENHELSGPAESVIHGYVAANMVNSPAPRRVSNLTMGTNQARGLHVRRTARFDNLATMLADIGELSGLGYRIMCQRERLVFETFKPIDRSKTIRMDLWNNTLASYDYTTKGATTTHSIVLGSNEGVKRDMVLRTSAESLAQEALWGRRIEKVSDKRGAKEIAELEQTGDEVIAKEGLDQSTVKFVPMDETTMRYQVDWNIGDLVTAVIEGKEITARVTAAIVSVDTNGVRVACALGDISSTSSGAALTKFQSTTNTRLNSLEANNGAPRVWFHTANNESEQKKLVEEARPTQDTPLYVRRTDTGSAGLMDLRATTDGFRWFQIGASVMPVQWHSLTINPPWTQYGGDYARSGYTKTASGIVVLKGLVTGGAGGSVLGTLPEGFRPDSKIMVAVAAGNNYTGSLDIHPDGQIVVRSMTAGSWVALDSVMFPAADPQRVWTPVSVWNIGAFADYYDQDRSWERFSYWIDQHGRVWFRGLFRGAGSAAVAADTQAFAIPAGASPGAQVHYSGFCSGGFATYHCSAEGAVVVKSGTKGTAWLTMSGSPAWLAKDYVSPGSYVRLAPTNLWVDYSSTFPAQGYYMAPDGIVSLQGLIKSGTFATMAGTLPAGYRTSSERRIYQANSTNAPARVDLQVGSQVVPMTGAATWTSLNGINYISEG